MADNICCLSQWHVTFYAYSNVQFSSVTQSCPTLQTHGLQHARLPCPSPTPGAYSNSCPSSRWCHPTILSSVIPIPSDFTLSQHPGLFQWISSSHQVAKVLEFQLQHQSFQWIFRTDWFPLGLTGLISLPSKGLSRVFSNTSVQKHLFFGAKLSLRSNFHIHTWRQWWFSR